MLLALSAAVRVRWEVCVPLYSAKQVWRAIAAMEPWGYDKVLQVHAAGFSLGLEEANRLDPGQFCDEP